MEELLERWSIAEPDRCRYEDGEWCVLFMDVWISFPDINMYQYDIEGIIYHAIESHDWQAQCYRNKRFRDYEALLNIHGDSTRMYGWHYESGRQETRGEALLTVYLMALKELQNTERS